MTKWTDCVGPGWYNLVLNVELAAQKKNVEIAQVKEKFGTLRIYTETSDSDLNTIINTAEKLSEVTCESCGGPGRLRNTHGWLKTMCDSHT